MGKKHLIGEQHNIFWNLEEMDGNTFEDNVYLIITKELESYFKLGLEIEQTKRSNDGGKDIVIISPVDIESLFGISFSLKGKSQIRIHIECKSTHHQNLRYDKIIPSTVKNKYQNIDYFVLLTNSEILPSTYYIVENELKQKNIEFKLIDQFIFANGIRNNYTDLFENVPLYQGDSDFYGEYQVFSVGDDTEYKYEIYFLFRNYGKKIQNCKLSLVSDINWHTNQSNTQFMIDLNNNYSKKIEVSSLFLKGLDNLMFRIEKNKAENFIYVNGANVNEYFSAPFIGSDNIRIRDSICNAIFNKKYGNIFFLWGIAGIGKTRIIDEIIKKMKGQKYDILKCSLKKNNLVAINKLIKFLKDKHYYDKDSENMNLSEIIHMCSNHYRKALIILDDFHYATAHLIEEEIKKINNHDSPIILIILGRTDYSYGHLEYFDFIQWTINKFVENKNLFEVKPLKTEETEDLIRALIKKIPDEALEILLKKSMNNPLYIIQYIEYLLGEKMVYIKNKNTVGISDVSYFMSRNSIPDKIAEIYECRIQRLKSEGKTNHVNFLYILSIYNGEMPNEIAIKYFDEDYEIIPELLSKRFIIQENKTYQFVHESLLIYISEQLYKNQKNREKISRYILDKHSNDNLCLSEYMLGRLFLWNNMFEKAKEKFSPIVCAVKKNNNISNLNIDLEMYDYLYDAFDAYKNEEKMEELLVKFLNIKIYITLHHLIPINAVRECEHCLLLVRESEFLKSNEQYVNSLLSQKAHALLNSGKNLDGFIVLNELQAKWILENNNVNIETLFDVMDRLSAIYIKYNIFNIALDYNNFELDVAEKFKNPSVSAIAYRTRSKLFYLNNYDFCKDALNEVNKILLTYNSPRIKVNNDIYNIILEFTYNRSKNYDTLLNEILSINEIATNNKFNRAIIQSELVAAAIYLKRNTKQDLNCAKNIAESAINYSIRFGIPSYMWQLYNLLGIIAIKQNEDTNTIMHYFETVFAILDKQNLLYCGNDQLCYSNILALSNIGFFWRQTDSELAFNKNMSKINYFGKELEKNYTISYQEEFSSERLKTMYERAGNKELLFFDVTSDNLPKDDETKYFIALT